MPQALGYTPLITEHCSGGRWVYMSFRPDCEVDVVSSRTVKTNQKGKHSPIPMCADYVPFSKMSPNSVPIII